MDLIPRAKAIILTPAQEWPVIAAEPNDAAALYLRYAAPLAAAAALASFIGVALISRMFGFSLGGRGLFSVLLTSILGFIFSMISLYLVARIASFLAPKFGGVENEGAALKLVVYSHTPGWIAALSLIFPPLGFLALLGLWGVYVFWTGVGPMLRVPDDKKLLFVITLAAVAIVLNLAISAVLF